MWGIDVTDLGERKAVAAEFSSLPIHKQHEWVTTAIFMSEWFQNHKRYARHRKKRLVKHIKWFSDSTKEELMTLWGLDKEVAEDLCNEVQAEEEKGEDRSLNNRLGKLIFEGLLPDPHESIYCDEEEAEEETIVYQSDYNIDDHKGRKEILRDVKLYRKKIEEITRKFSYVTHSMKNRNSHMLSTKVKSGKLVTKEGCKVNFECQCLDGVNVEPDPICFFESDFFLDNLAQGFTFDMPIKISSNILKMVNTFCVSRWMTLDNTFYLHHPDGAYSPHEAAATLDLIEYQFVSQQPLSILVQLMHAAIRLRIKSLTDMTRGEIVDRIKGKSADEILKIFNMPGFTHKELQESLIERPWAYMQ